MNFIAHRGNDNHKFGENTLAGILYSLNQKYISGVEIDVRLTKDKKLVVIHDYTINRVSDGNGIVSNMTLKELLKYNFGTKENQSKIKTLDQILKNIKSDKIIVIDIKVEVLDIKEMAEKLLKTINKYKNLNIILASFNPIVIDLIIGKTYHKIGDINLVGKIEDNSKFDAYFIFYYNFHAFKIDKPIFFFTINNKKFIIKNKENFTSNMYIISDKSYLLYKNA